MEIMMLAYEDILNPSGGLGVHVYNICKELSKYHNVTVVCMDIEKNRGGFFVGDKEVEYKDWKGRFRTLKAFCNNKMLSIPSDIFPYIDNKMVMDNILAFLKKDKFDIIHIHDSPLWNTAESLKILYECPIVYTCHLAHKFVHPRLTSERYRWGIQNEGNALHYSDRVITVSKGYAEKLKSEYGLKDVDVVYNGVEDFKNIKKIKIDNTIVFVGRLVNSKGIDIVLDAAKKLKYIRFIMIASISPTVEDISALCKKVKKYDKKYSNFAWLNGVGKANKLSIMRSATIGIMPSLHEPFGIVALEFMALRTPLIVSRIDGLKEFCNDSNSVGIEPNSKSLINAIKNYKKNDDRISEGFRTAKFMTWEKTNNKNMRIYEEVLAC